MLSLSRLLHLLLLLLLLLLVVSLLGPRRFLSVWLGEQLLLLLPPLPPRIAFEWRRRKLVWFERG